MCKDDNVGGIFEMHRDYEITSEWRCSMLPIFASALRDPPSWSFSFSQAESAYQHWLKVRTLDTRILVVTATEPVPLGALTMDVVCERYTSGKDAVLRASHVGVYDTGFLPTGDVVNAGRLALVIFCLTEIQFWRSVAKFNRLGPHVVTQFPLSTTPWVDCELSDGRWNRRAYMRTKAPSISSALSPEKLIGPQTIPMGVLLHEDIQSVVNSWRTNGVDQYANNVATAPVSGLIYEYRGFTRELPPVTLLCRLKARGSVPSETYQLAATPFRVTHDDGGSFFEDHQRPQNEHLEYIGVINPSAPRQEARPDPVDAIGNQVWSTSAIVNDGSADTRWRRAPEKNMWRVTPVRLLYKGLVISAVSTLQMREVRNATGNELRRT